MSWWSFRRKTTYIVSFFTVLGIFTATALFLLLNKPPSCFDGKKNQNEVGADCGGSCSVMCNHQIVAPTILWSRAFKVVDGRYHTTALVENQNENAGNESVGYVFKLYDADNKLINDKRGSVILPPRTRVAIFEPNIPTGNREPVRTFFEFGDASPWRRAIAVESPLKVENVVLRNESRSPRLTAEIHNTGIRLLRNTEVVALVSDVKGNTIAASKTIIGQLPKDSFEKVVFTWPLPFPRKVELCKIPADVALLLDASGSMNNDQFDPPQPLTAAKAAATIFIDRMDDLDQVGIIYFATMARMLRSLSADTDQAARAVRSIEIPPEEETGLTNVSEAIDIAIKELSSVRQAPRSQRAIVILTDGKANSPNEELGTAAALASATRAKQNGIAIYAIGLGQNADLNLLNAIASSDSQFFYAATRAELDNIYRKISASLCERGPGVIEILPVPKELNLVQ